MRQVLIQWLNGSEWQTTSQTDSSASALVINRMMKDAKASFGTRIRAVDENGSVLDILT